MYMILIIGGIMYFVHECRQRAEKEKNETLFVTAKQQDEIDKKYNRMFIKSMLIITGICILTLILIEKLLPLFL